MFCAAAALSSFDPNQPTRDIAFIMFSFLFAFVAGSHPVVSCCVAVGFVGMNPPFAAIAPSGMKSFDSFSSHP